MIGPLARILARYLSGALVTYGLLAPADAAAISPDIVAVVGAALGGAVEVVYAYARRKGWTL